MQAEVTSRCIVLGIGLRQQAQSQTLQSLWEQVQIRLQGRMDGTHFCVVAVLDSKAEHPALSAWLQTIQPTAQIISVSPQQMSGQAVQTQSTRLLASYGTGSVAEAAALFAAGPAAQLLLPRIVAEDGTATMAVAMRGHTPVCISAERHAGELPIVQGATA